MDDTGKNIVLMMEQLKKLYTQIALLLGSADDLMEERDWHSRSNQTLAISAVLQYSKNWAPRHAFRFYQNDSAKHILPFISVILYDRDGDSVGGVTEPIVTAGWCDYGDVPVSDVWFDWAMHHVRQPQRRDDGTILSVDPMGTWYPKGTKCRRFSSLGVPLMEIKGVEDLRARIVEPFLIGLNQATANAAAANAEMPL